MTSTTKIQVSKLKLNEKNPRLIKDEKFKKLVKSIQEFPEMLQLRPIVVDENNIILGGNMRFRACVEAGLKEVYIIKAETFTEKQKEEFIIKDNVGYGEWDWDIIAEEWEYQELTDWGLDIAGVELNGNFKEQDEYNFQNKVTIEFDTFEQATQYYETAIKENLKARLS